MNFQELAFRPIMADWIAVIRTNVLPFYTGKGKGHVYACMCMRACVCVSTVRMARIALMCTVYTQYMHNTQLTVPGLAAAFLWTPGFASSACDKSPHETPREERDDVIRLRPRRSQFRHSRL